MLVLAQPPWPWSRPLKRPQPTSNGWQRTKPTCCSGLLTSPSEKTWLVQNYYLVLLNLLSGICTVILMVIIIRNNKGPVPFLLWCSNLRQLVRQYVSVQQIQCKVTGIRWLDYMIHCMFHSGEWINWTVISGCPLTLLTVISVFKDVLSVFFFSSYFTL